MEELNEVKVHGMWCTTYSKRVELALKIKGIPYEYVEEDLMNKSELLLLYNPLHKKVPILVHNGRPISESLVILEYIDENWNNFPRLLPEEPYQRAQVRFWANFIQQQLFQSLSSVITQEGQEQEKALKQLYENVRIVEEGMKDIFPDFKPSFDDQKTPAFLTIAMSAILGTYKAIEEVTGLKIIDPQINPLIFSWVTALNDLPVSKECLPPHEMLVPFIRHFRESILFKHPKLDQKQ